MHLTTPSNRAAAMPQDELVAGLSRQPESIHTQALLAHVLKRANLQRALKQVRQNKGAPGIDGMTVDELPKYLLHHWRELRAQLEAGSYRPQPVRRVEIPKPEGKTRTAQTRRHRARSVEHQQVGPWPVAAVQDTGHDDCVTIALLRNYGTTQPCATVGIQLIEPPDT